MSCNCNNKRSNDCHEAHLSLGLSNDKSMLIGSLDGQYLKPVQLRDTVKANETITALRYDPSRRLLIFENERSRNGQGSPDQISAQELLAGADISAVGGVQPLVVGGLASSAIIDGRPQVQFEVPIPVEASETSDGFITYVANPNNGTSHYKLVRPDLSSTGGSVLVGDASGSVEFKAPIDSPILVPIGNLTSNGSFSGSPSVSSGTWRYQQMGESQIITNDFGTAVEVTLRIRWSMQTAGNRSGFYASLVSGGSDYQTQFVEGQSNIKQEGYPGGFGEWTCVLDPSQRCQFRFGGWTNGAGNMEITTGSYDESGGTPQQTVQQPSIFIRRLI